MSTASPRDVAPPATNESSQQQPTGHPTPTRIIVLVRHGQTTYNVEGRLPGQLPGIPLTDEGRSQAHRAAVALAAMPLTTVISSTLERARDTAEIIARGWGLPVRQDPRLMDTDVGRWSGQKIDEVAKNDPQWKEFLAHPTQEFPGVESILAVQQRAVAAVEDARRDPSAGDYIVLVAHADVVKVILAYYLKTPLECALHIAINNASLSALAFHSSNEPQVLGMNWTSAPAWLVPPSPKPTPQSTVQGPVAAEERGGVGEAHVEGDEAAQS